MKARVWLWGSGIAFARVGVLWYLIYREWTHQQSLATLPLILLLLPEALLLPQPMIWTAKLGLMFSAVLSAGSFLFVGFLALMLRWLRLR